jgi:hypothetical protein
MNYSPLLDSRHLCPGCHEPTGPRRVACVTCWRRLPLELQTRIHVTRWGDDIAGHAVALQDVAHWYAAHPTYGDVRVW